MYFPCLLHVTTLPQGVLDSLKGTEQTLSTLSLDLCQVVEILKWALSCVMYSYINRPRKQTTTKRKPMGCYGQRSNF